MKTGCPFTKAWKKGRTAQKTRKRRRNRENSHRVGFQIAADLKDVTQHGFGVLRTGIDTVTAQDTLLRHDLCLIVFIHDGIDRTRTNTFVAVLTSNLF